MAKKSKEPVLGDIIITEEQIAAKAVELGKEITEDYRGESVILLGILRGSIMWIAELMKRIDLDTEIDFMACSSYGSGTKSSGRVKVLKDLDSDITGRNVLIVEDIVDSGITLNYLKGYIENRGAASVRICTLLDKPDGRKVDIHVDYVGFTIENNFIVGYGLDYDQKYRNLPYICLMKEE